MGGGTFGLYSSAGGSLAADESTPPILAEPESNVQLLVAAMVVGEVVLVLVEVGPGVLVEGKIF